MGRNAVIGCLSAILLLFVGLVLAGYFLVWRPAQAFVQNLGAYTEPLLRGTPETTGETALRDEPELTRDQVRQFVRVRRDIREAVGQDFGQLQNVYTDFTQGQAPTTLELLVMLRDASGFIGRAREAHLAALEREGLTPEEYAQVRRVVNRAVGLPDIDLAGAARELQGGRLPDFNQVVIPPSERNQRLIEPFLAELRVTAPLGLLGL